MAKKTGDFIVCKKSADQFLKIAEWCNEDSVRFLSESFYPYAVNIALACELYFKGIMIKRSSTGEFSQGHDLLDLYNKLDISDRNMLATDFSQEYSELSISDFLNQNKDVFVSWRYSLESRVQINITGFNALGKVLKKYVEDLEKGIR